MMWGTKRPALLLSTLLLVIPLNSAGQESSSRVTDIANQLFLESAHLLGGVRNPVLRWYEEINIALFDDTGHQLIVDLNSIFKELSLLTGVSYRIVDHEIESGEELVGWINEVKHRGLKLCDNAIQETCANFFVLVTDRISMHEFSKAVPLRPVFQKATLPNTSVPCFFSPGYAKELNIKRSVIYINKTLGRDMLATCLSEEIYQSLGLFGDYRDSVYFSFNDQIEPKEITNFDKSLITSLYDGAFRAGVTANPIARQFSSYCSTQCF